MFKSLAFAFFTVLFFSNQSFCETVKLQEFGVTFSTPKSFVEIESQLPVSRTWVDASQKLSLMIILQKVVGADKEFRSGDSAARTAMTSFADSQIRLLKNTFQTNCSYSGNIKEQQIATRSYLLDVDFKCDRDEYSGLKRLVFIVTSVGVVTLRFDFNSTDPNLIKITNEVWDSLKVESSKITPLIPILQSVNVSGGQGFHIVDYGQVRWAAIIGQLTGGIFVALFLGSFFTWLLMKVKLNLITSVLISQLLVVLLQIWGHEKDGVWELDPILYSITFILGALIIIFSKRKKQIEIQPRL